MLKLKILVLCLGLGIVHAVDENQWLNTKRKQVWKVLSGSIIEVYFNCNEKSLFSYDVFTDFIEFWNMKYELKHNEYGCAFLCVAYQLELIDRKMQFIIPNFTRLLEVHGADPDMIKIDIELYEYCRNTIHDNIQGLTIQPCWLALEFLRCYRDGIEDMNWIPDISDLIPNFLRKMKTTDKRRSFDFDKIETVTTISSGNVSIEVTSKSHLVKRETYNNNISEKLIVVNANKNTEISDLEYASITNSSSIPRFLDKIFHNKDTTQKKYNFRHWRRYKWLYPKLQWNYVEHQNVEERRHIPKC